MKPLPSSYARILSEENKRAIISNALMLYPKREGGANVAPDHWPKPDEYAAPFDFTVDRYRQAMGQSSSEFQSLVSALSEYGEVFLGWVLAGNGRNEETRHARTQRQAKRQKVLELVGQEQGALLLGQGEDVLYSNLIGAYAEVMKTNDVPLSGIRGRE